MTSLASKLSFFLKESSDYTDRIDHDGEINHKLNISHYRGGMGKILEYIAQNGKLDMLQFMHDKFKFTNDDMRTDKNVCLRTAAEYGHDNIIKYLKNEFVMGYDDASECDNYALVKACGNGHLTVVESLFELYGFTMSNVTYSVIKALVLNDQIDIIQYLKNNGHLTSSMIIESKIMNTLCVDTTFSKIKNLGKSRKNLEMVKYLVKEFDFTCDELSHYYTCILQLIAEKGDIDFLSFIHTKYC